MKILISILLAISLYGAEESILQMVKEKNGIILTKEEMYFNEMKQNLINSFQYYDQNYLLNKKDIEYIKTEKMIKEMKNINELFSKELTERKFQIKTIKGELTEYTLGDIIFQNSLKNKEYLEIALKNKLLRTDINESYITKENQKIVLNYMVLNKIIPGKRNTFLNLELVLKNELQNNAISLYQDYEIDQKNYLYFTINQKDIMNSNGIKEIFISKLKKDIENKREIEEEYVLLNPKEIGKLKSYHKPYYSIIKFKIKTTLVSYLLTASNSTFFFKKQNEFFNNVELTEALIKDRFKELYGMNDLNVYNIEELIAIYGNGSLIKITNKNEFLKKFNEQI